VALKGIDLAYCNGTPPWEQLGPLDFVIIKASEGASAVDTSYAYFRDQARSRGILRGWYHYARPEVNTPIIEADHFVQTVSPLQPGEILCLDVEDKAFTIIDTVGWCLVWLNHVEQLTGVKPFVYTQLSHVQDRDWSRVMAQGYPLWLADWTPTAPYLAWHFPLWQNAGTGPLGSDSDVFFGTPADWQRFGHGAMPSLTEVYVSRAVYIGKE
jgi:lysozyme